MRFLFTFCVLLVAIATTCAAPLPPHPRLLATTADFDRVRGSIGKLGLVQDTFAFLLQAGERELASPPLERVAVGRRLLATSRDAVRRLLNFALLYRVIGEPKWSARAEQELLALAAFSDWHPEHFLDTAEMAAAVAIG